MAAAREHQGARGWEYLCPFRKKWVDVSPEEDALLARAHAGGHDETEYELYGTRFHIDFAVPSRTNLATKRSMELRQKAAPGSIPPSETAAAVAPENLVCPSTGALVSADIRRAWGQGIPEGFSLAGSFSFVLQVEDRDRLGELLFRHMLSAGIDAQAMDAGALVFTDRRGQTASGSREVVQSMLNRENVYPVTVTYSPQKAYQGMTPEQMINYEVFRTHLRAVRDTVREMGGDLKNVKHKHQRKTFERYLLYLEDYNYQTGDDLQDAMSFQDLVAKYPHLLPAFALTSKTLGNLTGVLRGEVDILDYLFGT